MGSNRLPSVDPELASALQPIADALPTGLTFERIESARAASARPDDARLRRDGAIELQELSVPRGTDGPPLPLLLCRPSTRSTTSATVCFIHGGGMVLGDNRTGIESVLDWVEHLAVSVVSIDYRLAPEHPYPAAIDDCLATIRWIVAEGGRHGLRPDRIVVAGASAGGGLAAGLTLRLRDQGGPRALAQVLMGPMLDDKGQVDGTRINGTSDGVWDYQSNLTGWTALLGAARGRSSVSPYAAPARASDLSDLPPTYFDVGALELFRDEVVDFAARFWQAGGSGELHVWGGAYHGFERLAPTAAVSVTARETRMRWLRGVLSAADA